MGLVGAGEKERADLLRGMNEYKRVGSEVEGDDFDNDLVHYQRQLERRKSTRRYVFACAVFVSLNTVLLGYGIAGVTAEDIDDSGIEVSTKMGNAPNLTVV
ncbi:hypothetical protein NL676_000857 [Syzygium grande]|nr:hypothetical protein NL676_000857 [Syzygium grande]